MAKLNISPQLQQFTQDQPDTLQAIANFIVDNNKGAVETVLTKNGYVFNTAGEAAIIVKSILSGLTPKLKNELAQLSVIPYNNNNTNGTGGLLAPINTPMTAGIGDDLVCVVSSLFSFPIACPTPGLTPIQQEEQRRLAAELAAKQQRTTYIVIGVGVVILLTAIYFFSKKNKKSV